LQNIAGPLPRSWMRSQWDLQKQILARYKSLAIKSQLPGFQGNVPWALAAILTDSNMTQQGDTGWMNSVDPEFATIADMWMKQLLADFGQGPDGWTDQFFQMDGYFDGLVPSWAPPPVTGSAAGPRRWQPTWKTQGIGAGGEVGSTAALPQPRRVAAAAAPAPVSGDLPACVWSALLPATYLAGCDQTACKSYPTLSAAQAACVADVTCGGITSQAGGVAPWQLREGNEPMASPDNEASYYVTNAADCRPPPPPITPDPVWMLRGKAAYAGLTRTAPNATWFYQGWAL
jgi:hypothetical protein